MTDDTNDSVIIEMPDDFHHHLRDNEFLPSVLSHATRQFKSLIAMPNIKPPVLTLQDAIAYKQRITAAMPVGSETEIFMTLYLTDKTTSDQLIEAKNSGIGKPPLSIHITPFPPSLLFI